jgi:hypothetical protein
VGQFLRRGTFAGIEALAPSSARPALDLVRCGDDALGYLTERLRPAVTRRAAVTAVRQAKRNKAFDNCRFLGLAVDGTGWRGRTARSAAGVGPTGTASVRSSATTIKW